MRQPAAVGDWRPRRLCASSASVRCFSPLFFIVLAFSVTLIYPWAREGSSIAPDVARLMLNTRLYAVYGLVALLGWAAIALLLAAGRLGLFGASLSLVFHGVAISVVSVAWLLSVDPRFTDSGFGAEIAVQQILFALAAIAALSPARAVAVAKATLRRCCWRAGSALSTSAS